VIFKCEGHGNAKARNELRFRQKRDANALLFRIANTKTTVQLFCTATTVVTVQRKKEE